MKKKPSTSELLDWLKLLLVEDISPEVLRTRDPAKLIPPLHGALLRTSRTSTCSSASPSCTAASRVSLTGSAAAPQPSRVRAGPSLSPARAGRWRGEGRPPSSALAVFFSFFAELRAAKVPVSLREYLTLMEAMQKRVAAFDIEEFYFLARTSLVKDERHLDRFDRVFGHCFKGIETLADPKAEIPEEWLKKLTERFLTEEEKKQIEALGGWEKLMETLRQRLAEQKARHQGGSKWIGTAGTSPFGAYGYNPEGVRIGARGGQNRSAVKVWDRREFRNLDDTSSSAPATSSWRYAACGNSPARGPPKSSISTPP